jgi:hypothetical protein
MEKDKDLDFTSDTYDDGRTKLGQTNPKTNEEGCCA